MAVNSEMEAVSNTELTNQDENKQAENKADGNELILIQDNVFGVKIHVPGLEPFDLQVWFYF
jgi:hypothetical protein